MRHLTLILLCVLVVVAVPAAADMIGWWSDANGHIFYVKPSGNDTANDGLSWANAKQTIQSAVVEAVAYGDSCQIWVAATTPSSAGTQDTYIASSPIVLPDGCSLIGGFDGTETQMRQRNYREHVTIISGSVTLRNSALDGFTIRNPGGNGVTCTDDSGGLVSHNIIESVSTGVYCTSCAYPIVMNNLIKDFTANGIWAYSGLPTCIDHNTIVQPGAQVGSGIHFSGAASYTGCTTTRTSITSNIITGCEYGVQGYDVSICSATNNLMYHNGDNGVSGQFDDNPMFVSPTTGNYRLGPDSPCLDVVNWYEPWEDWDLDCNYRGIDIPGAGSDPTCWVDLGAYERFEPLYFIHIEADPGEASTDDQVTITFARTLNLVSDPTVEVNGHSASYVSRSGSWYTYSYTVQDSDPDGWAEIEITGTSTNQVPGSVTDSSVLWIFKPMAISDEDGVRTIANANGTSTTYSYDERYRLKQVLHSLDSTMISQVDYKVDGVGNRTEIWFDNDATNKKNLYTYDEINRLAGVTDYATGVASWSYDWVGNRLGTGLSYDAADRLNAASWVYSDTGALLEGGSPSRTYIYDPRDLVSTVSY